MWLQNEAGSNINSVKHRNTLPAIASERENPFLMTKDENFN